MFEVREITPPQRRMLLEALASEQAGEDALYVGPRLGRDVTADGLVTEELAIRIDTEHVILSSLGRRIAEGLVVRLVDNRAAARLTC